MAVRPNPGCAVFPLGSRGEIILHRRDCISGMHELLEPESVDVVVTSPPYNLGVSYRSYDDTAPRNEYLDWIEAWGEALHRVLSRGGSLFLNVSGKPSDPWGPFEILQRLRNRFSLQNTLHWIKSIAIDSERAEVAIGETFDSRDDRGGISDPAGSTSAGDAGVPAKSITVGHYKPINSRRYVNDCHEYIFHLTKFGDVELDRLAVGVEYQDKSNVDRWSGAKDDLPLPRQHLVHSVPDDSEPGQGTAAPGDVPGQDARDVHPAARTATGRPRHGSLPRTRTHRPGHARHWGSPSWASSWTKGTSRRRAICLKALIPRRWKVGPRISYPFSEGNRVGLTGRWTNQLPGLR